MKMMFVKKDINIFVSLTTFHSCLGCSVLFDSCFEKMLNPVESRMNLQVCILLPLTSTLDNLVLIIKIGLSRAETNLPNPNAKNNKRNILLNLDAKKEWVESILTDAREEFSKTLENSTSPLMTNLVEWALQLLLLVKRKSSSIRGSHQSIRLHKLSIKTQCRCLPFHPRRPANDRVTHRLQPESAQPPVPTRDYVFASKSFTVLPNGHGMLGTEAMMKSVVSANQLLRDVLLVLSFREMNLPSFLEPAVSRFLSSVKRSFLFQFFGSLSHAIHLFFHYQTLGHAFHLQCVATWLNSNKQTCPICRADWEYGNSGDRQGSNANNATAGAAVGGAQRATGTPN